MLTQLAIRDIVLIEQATIPFAKGLCVLSGETGAGKSILLDSLGLAIGNRAETRLVRSGKEQGVVTAEFDISDAPPHIYETLQELGLESDGDTLFIRRIVQADGKNRCFINDQPVSATALKTLGGMLVEIHGQHDQRGLLDPSSHRDLLDAYGNLHMERTRTEQAFRHWRTQAAELAALQQQVAQAKAEEDYLRHNLEELEALSPEADEEATLAEKRQNMMHAEKRISSIQSALDELQGSTSVSSSLNAAVRILARSTSLDAERCSATADLLEQAAALIEEAVKELEHIAEESRFSSTELEQIEERLFALRGLARKHQTDVAGLAPLMEHMRRQLVLLESQETSLAVLEAAVVEAKHAYEAAAGALSTRRQTVAVTLQQAVMEELGALKMGGTKVVVLLEPLAEPHWQAEGWDRVTFLASTNPGTPPAPLVKIASGGELSRFMLALKVAMRDVRSTPTVIFDEIDTGTGGAVADAIGRRLARLGEVAQVLVVTHLPQVAARGGHHLRVSKAVNGGETRTQVEALNDTHRREELARMLAGEDITDEARAAALKLMAG